MVRDCEGRNTTGCLIRKDDQRRVRPEGSLGGRLRSTVIHRVVEVSQ